MDTYALCTKYCSQVRNYKISRGAETLGLYMTVKFNRNKIKVDI